MEWFSDILVWVAMMITGNLTLAMGFIAIRDTFKKKWWSALLSTVFLIVLVWVHLIVIQSFIR